MVVDKIKIFIFLFTITHYPITDTHGFRNVVFRNVDSLSIFNSGRWLFVIIVIYFYTIQALKPIKGLRLSSNEYRLVSTNQITRIFKPQ